MAYNDLDILPWYKQFYPWLLIGLLGTAVICSIGLVVIAVGGADTLVADNYYKDGLAINSTVDDLEAAKKLNLNATISIDSQQINIELDSGKMLPDDQTMSDEKIILELHHPLNPALDTIIRLANSGNHVYRGVIPAAIIDGKWYIDIYPDQQHHAWRLKTQAYFPFTSLKVSANEHAD